MKKQTALLLHDIRSAHNVGSIFRTADAAGVSKVFLSGVTPAPQDRFGRAQRDIAKTALGAERYLIWEYKKSPAAIISALRKKGWAIVAVEQDAHALDYRKFRIKKPTLFVLGNEVSGVPKQVLKRCDAILEIPMRGRKESLNVSVAAGVVLFSAL